MGRFGARRPLMLAITTTLALLVMAINVYLVIQFFDGMSAAVVACICVPASSTLASARDGVGRPQARPLRSSAPRSADGDGDDVVVHLRVSGAVGVAPSADDEERAGAAAKAATATADIPAARRRRGS